MNPLVNPIWNALTTTHARFAQGDANALRYPRDITTMGAFGSLPPDARGWESLGKLVEPGETIAVLFHEPVVAPNGWEVVRRVEIVQMVHDGRTFPDPKPTAKTVTLSATESAEIVELAKLTNPGPIGTRSHEIGDFIGIRNDDGQLIAMAGE